MPSDPHAGQHRQPESETAQQNGRRKGRFDRHTEQGEHAGGARLERAQAERARRDHGDDHPDDEAGIGNPEIDRHADGAADQPKGECVQQAR